MIGKSRHGPGFPGRPTSARGSVGQCLGGRKVGVGAADDFDTVERQQAIQVDAGSQPAPGDSDSND